MLGEQSAPGSGRGFGWLRERAGRTGGARCHSLARERGGETLPAGHSVAPRAPVPPTRLPKRERRANVSPSEPQPTTRQFVARRFVAWTGALEKSAASETLG